MATIPWAAGVFAREGSIIVAHENARRAFALRSAPEYADRVQRTRLAQSRRPGVRPLPAAPPQLTFRTLDHRRRQGAPGRGALFRRRPHAGDVFTFLPPEKLVLTGDACVNGARNTMADANTASWIQVLGKVQGLAPDIVVPGHGALGKVDLLETRSNISSTCATRWRPDQTGQDRRSGGGAGRYPRWRQWTGQTQVRPENVAHVFRELSPK